MYYICQLCLLLLFLFYFFFLIFFPAASSQSRTQHTAEKNVLVSLGLLVFFQ